MTRKQNAPEIRFEGFTDPWEQRKLGDCASFGGGHTPSMADSENYDGGNIPWVTSQDVKTHYLAETSTLITAKGARELTFYPVGSIAMVTRSGILRHTLPVAELHKPMVVNQDIRVIIPHKELSGQWLLQYLIGHERPLLLEYGKVGTTVESVDFSKMQGMTFPLPKMDEQCVIGAFFASIDNLITLHQRMCPIFCFCAHGLRTDFASILQGLLRVLRYPRPVPKMIASPSAPASGVFDTAGDAFVCGSSSAGVSLANTAIEPLRIFCTLTKASPPLRYR